jgi:hypothetical protein
MRKLSIRIVAIFFLMAAFAGSGMAQGGPLCDDGSTDCGDTWHNAGPITKNVNGCAITITYQWRCCYGSPHGTLQYRYSLESHVGAGCAFFKDSSIYQLIDLFLIQAATDNAEGATICDGGNASQITHVEFITAACYIWQDCTYPSDGTVPTCVPAYPAHAAPAPGGPVDVWSFHSCGTVCCKRTYSVIDNFTPDYLGNQVTVTLISKIRLAPGCSLEPNFAPKSCNDGC